MQNASLDESEAGIKITNNLTYVDDTALMAESKEELKRLLMKVKESKKAGLKLNIKKTKSMGSSAIISWQIDGETMETVVDFTLLDSKVTEDGDCNHGIKRHLLLGRKTMKNLDSPLKSIDITLRKRSIHLKLTVFPVAMYRCES